MLQLVKQLYLAEFTTFYKAGSSWWTPVSNASKGAAGVAFFEWLFLFGVAAWFDIGAGARILLQIPKLIFLAGYFGLFFANYYFLVIRGHGVAFEQAFDSLHKSKRVWLRISCYLMEAAIFVFVMCTIFAYHRAFNIIPK